MNFLPSWRETNKKKKKTPERTTLEWHFEHELFPYTERKWMSSTLYCDMHHSASNSKYRTFFLQLFPPNFTLEQPSCVALKVIDHKTDCKKHRAEIIGGIFNCPAEVGSPGGYLVRLRCSIKAVLECQVSAESGDYRAMRARGQENGLALCRWPSDIQACIFWISLEWLGQRQSKDRSNNYFPFFHLFFSRFHENAGYYYYYFFFLPFS